MLTLDSVYRAKYVLKDVVRKTDVIYAPKLRPGVDIYLKTENLQITGSFKVRGAYYKMTCLTEEESDLCRRAANSKHLQHPKHASDADYRQATAFEALLGMHAYLGNEDRLSELLDASYHSFEGRTAP